MKAVPAVVTALGMLVATEDAAAQSAAQREQWARDCAAIGGRLNFNTGVCEGATGGGGGGGYSQQQQAMLNLAGQFGSLLGNAIRQSFQRSARQAEADRIRRAWEAEQARAAAALAADEQRQRSQALLANMIGTVGAPELTMRRTQSGAGLQLLTVDDIDWQRAAGGQTLPGSGPADSASAQQVWDSYFAALQARNEAERASTIAAGDLAGATDLVSGTRREVEAQRARFEAAPLGSEDRRLAEVRLTEMEQAFADAARMRDQAESSVAAASVESGDAEGRLAVADARRRELRDETGTQTVDLTSAASEPHTDTSVVDARQPLTQQLVYDPALNSVYYSDANRSGTQQLTLPRIEEIESSPGREAWLRGMTAAANHDWQAAETAFREAQARDPSNQALGQAVALAEFTRDAARRTAALPPEVRRMVAGEDATLMTPNDSGLALRIPDVRDNSALRTPDDSDLALLFPDPVSGERTPEELARRDTADRLNMGALPEDIDLVFGDDAPRRDLMVGGLQADVRARLAARGQAIGAGNWTDGLAPEVRGMVAELREALPPRDYGPPRPGASASESIDAANQTIGDAWASDAVVRILYGDLAGAERALNDAATLRGGLGPATELVRRWRGEQQEGVLTGLAPGAAIQPERP